MGKELNNSMADLCVIDERVKIMLDTAPIACNFWDKNFNLLDCNEATVTMFGLKNKQEYVDNFYHLSPEFQPDGTLSVIKAAQNFREAAKKGYMRFEWVHQNLQSEPIPTEITLIRKKIGGEYYVLSYTQDLREIKKSMEKIKETDELKQAMFDAMPLCCNVWDEKLNHLECNQETLTLFGLSSKQEFLNRFNEMSPKHQPDGCLSSEKVTEKVKEAFETGRCRFEWMHQRADADPIPTEITLVKAKHGEKNIVIAYAKDLREIKASIEKMRAADERTKMMLDATPLCCNFWDEKFNNIDCNQEAVNLFDLANKQEYLDKFSELSPQYQPDGRLSSEKALEKIREAFDNGRAKFEWMHKKINGELIPAEITLVRMRQDDHDIVLGYTRDLRELKDTVAMLEQLEILAFTDGLTGAYNRRYFMDMATKEFLRSVDSGNNMVIIIFDLDKFKDVNDTHGHLVGDEMLKAVTKSAQEILRTGDILARYGGEEFLVFLNRSSLEAAQKLAWRICEHIGVQTFDCLGHQLKITVSLGVALRNKNAPTLEEVIKNADCALYKAKAAGRNTVMVYDE